MKTLKANFELWIVLFALFTLLLLYWNIGFSDRLMVMGLGTLSLYYLLSGTLVLMNRQFPRMIRLLYFIGLWSISIGLVSFIYKLRFWVNGDQLLLFAIGFSISALLGAYAYYRFSDAGKRLSLSLLLRNLFMRLFLFTGLFLLLYLLPNKLLYDLFGEFRNDSHHTRLILDRLAEPDNQTFKDSLEKYEELINQRNDNSGSPTNR